jgi:hypothetical protein
MEEFKQSLRQIPSVSDSLLTDILANVEYYAESSPWKYIPGPWLISVCIPENKDLKISRMEKFIVILGASDKNQRGIGIFSELNDYVNRSQYPMPRAISLMFENGKTSRPRIFKGDGFDVQRASRFDIEFLEVALRAVADFILESARLGGGGPSRSSSNNASIMSPIEIVSHLTVGQQHYPCVQSVATSRGTLTVQVGIQPTQTAYQHTVTRGVTPLSPESITPLPSNMKHCMVCKKTESDCRSVSGRGLLLCSRCNSVTERYCGQECQRKDWKRHKQTCNSSSD